MNGSDRSVNPFHGNAPTRWIAIPVKNGPKKEKEQIFLFVEKLQRRVNQQNEPCIWNTSIASLEH
ncbi:hypothetical protein L914_13171 [Phytophthora nicotianae]|uniref:Uncharacterized protein n=1 Tax=Phytophthora nicotianae TaxID=4792 RepID=W2MXA1_PHYNI|nr:hypothetical protein L914_13171 [Phytophthora nicotianae]